MSVPSMMIEPLSGLSSPMRVFSRTDLPVPEGPSMTQISPAGMSRVTSPQISCLPKLLVRLLILISTPMTVSCSSHRIGARHCGFEIRYLVPARSELLHRGGLGELRALVLELPHAVHVPATCHEHRPGVAARFAQE